MSKDILENTSSILQSDFGNIFFAIEEKACNVEKGHYQKLELIDTKDLCSKNKNKQAQHIL